MKTVASGWIGQGGATPGHAITHVIFDFDGTLVDSNAIKEEGFLALAASHPGGPDVMTDVLTLVGGDRRTKIAAYRRAMEVAVPDVVLEDVEALVMEYSAAVDRAVIDAPTMPGAEALLDTLRAAGRRCYLSSATPIENLREIVAARGWSAYFDALFGHPRTKIDTLRHLMEGSGDSASVFAVVGDGADDRDSAAATGCVFFSVGEGRGRSADEPLYGLADIAALLVPPNYK